MPQIAPGKKPKEELRISHLPKIAQAWHKEANFYRCQKNKQYLVGQLLGKGGFACCYEAVELGEGKTYALKVLDKESENMKKRGAKNRLKNEMMLMSQLKHENVVKLVNAFEDEHNYYLVLELCSNNCLNEVIRARGRLSEAETKHFIRQLAYALAYLKKNNIIHRDIKTSNILLDEELVLKLGDFGLAVNADRDDPDRFTLCGTANYMAPEVIRRQRYGIQIDIWAMGVVAFTLLCGCNPFYHKDKVQTEKKITSLNYSMEAFNKLSAPAKDFLKKIFVSSVTQRMTPEQALAHEFLTDQVPRSLPKEKFLALFYEGIERNRSRETNAKQKIQPDACEKERNKQPCQQNKQTSLVPYLFSNNQKGAKTVVIGNNQKHGQPIAEVNEPEFEVKIQPDSKFQQNMNILIMQAAGKASKEPNQQGEERLNKLGTQEQQNKGYCVQEMFQESDPLTVDKFTNKTIQSLNSWLVERLQSQPYIHEFTDQTPRFGLCFYLSNGVKAILFNDKTVMAILEHAKKVVYIQPINNRSQSERLMYRLVESQKADYFMGLHYSKTPQPKIQAAATLSRCEYEVTEFKTHELPENPNLIKKYFTLKNYCRKCSNPISTATLDANVDLVQNALHIKKWAYSPTLGHYVFFTKSFVQVELPDYTKLFIMRASGQMLYVDCQMGQKHQISATLPEGLKALPEREKSKYTIAMGILASFAEKENESKQRKQLYGISIK